MSTPSSPLDPSSSIDALPGVGPKVAACLGRLEIPTVQALLDHAPMRYEREHAETTIGEADQLLPDGDDASGNLAVRGELAAVRTVPGRRVRIEATLEDDTGSARLVWFNAAWLARKLRPGMSIVVEGRATRWKGYLQFANPTWRPADDEGETSDDGREERLRPVYPASEDLASRRIEPLVATALDLAADAIVDPLPADLRRARALPGLAAAYECLHRPESRRDAANGRRRLAYDELLLLQLGVMMKRRHLRETLSSPALPLERDIDARIRERLPFELTHDQDRVCAEIARDLETTRPMNRLLQGDVGSGKTAVAAYAMLLAAAHGHQAAIMAPTGILAEQHHASISRLLAGAKAEVGLLTGSTGAAERRELLARLASGDLDLVVGTHALLSDDAAFHSLGLVVIDEQHRFGVEQRSRLRRPDDHGRVPHVLVMTATPIPRTLSLTIFGDLDASVIHERPPGRSPTVTRVVEPGKAGDVYGYLAERVAAGEQGFVVVPAVEESELGIADVEGHRRRLAEGPLRDCRLEILHGRLSAGDRDAVMERFRNHEIDVLVATVVIEVGVDVPNATMIVIEHAERFGLAQLHQLRGRVGRGEKRGICAFIGDPTTEDGRARLEAIGSTDDGFRIAELDLEIRGPGELFGARQSGLPPFHFADLVGDLDILRIAREDAARWIERDPALLAPEAGRLRSLLNDRYGEVFGLGDVG